MSRPAPPPRPARDARRRRDGRLGRVAVAGALLSLTGCGLGTLTGIAVVTLTRDESKDLPLATVASVSPASGSHGGGTVVTIRGSNFFRQGLVVTIGGVQAELDTFVSSSEVRVVQPALTQAGPSTVRVTSDVARPGELAGGFTATNTVPSCAIDPIPDGQAGSVGVQVNLVDVDSSALAGDDADLTVEYSVDGGPFAKVVQDAWILGGLAATRALSGGPTAPGTTHVFVVDTRQFAPGENVALQFRVTPVDTFGAGTLGPAARSGAPALSNQFTLVNNNPPLLTLRKAPAEDDNVVTLEFAADDTDANPTLTLQQVRFLNLQTGRADAATVDPESPVAVGGTLTPGANVAFLWDSRADLGFGNDALVQVEVAVSDGSNTTVRTYDPFFVNNGPFERTRTLNTVDATRAAGVGDIDGDGLGDLVFATENTSQVLIYEGDVDGSYGLRIVPFHGAGYTGERVRCGGLDVVPFVVGTATFDRVLYADVADVSSGIVAIPYDPVADAYGAPAPVLSDAQLMAPLSASGTEWRVKGLAHGDFSDPPDGRDDLLALVRDGSGRFQGGPTDLGAGDGQVLLFEQTAGGTLSTAGSVLLPAAVRFGYVPPSNGPDTVHHQPGWFSVRDADGDGLADVVVAAADDRRVSLYSQVPGDASVALVLSASVTVTRPGQTLVAADAGDVNGDGYVDLVALTHDGVAASTVFVYPGGPAGVSATPAAEVSLAQSADELIVVNVTDVADHDARDDVVYGGVSVASLGLLVSSGTATLSGFLEDASGAVIEHAFSSGVGGVRGLVSGDLHGHGHVDDVVCATTDSAAPIYRVALPRLFRDPAPVSVQHIALTLAGGDLLAQDPNDEVFTIDSVTQDLLVLGYDSELVLAERAYSPFRAQQCVVSVDGDGDGEVDDLMHLVPSADGLLILGVAIITSSTDLVGQRPSQTGFLDIDPNDLGSVPLGGQVDRIVSGSLSLVGSRVQAKTVVLAGGSRLVFFEQENGQFGYPSSVGYQLAAAFGDVGTGDDGAGAPLTGAGLPDIVVSPLAPGLSHSLAGLFILYGDAAGEGFTRAQRILAPANQPGISGTFDNQAGGFVDLALVDLNGDGRLSVVCGVKEDDDLPDVTGALQNSLTILDQDAGGVGLDAFYAFDPGSRTSGLVFIGMTLATGDYDDDGYTDLALASHLGPSCNILLNQGTLGFHDLGVPNPAGRSATFRTPLELVTEPRPWEVASGDFDRDGLEDLAIATLSGAISVYSSEGNGQFTLERLLEVAGEPHNITAADVNGDGKLDLVVTDLGSGSLNVFLHK